MIDIDEEKGEEALSDLGERRERARFLVCDVSDPERVAATVTGVVVEFGGIGIVVNAAGVAPAQRLVSRDGNLFDLDLFTFTIGVNLIGMFDVIRNVAGVMAGNEPDGNGERGAIVNVASWELPGLRSPGACHRGEPNAQRGGDQTRRRGPHAPELGAVARGKGPVGCVAPGPGVPSAGGPVGRRRGASPLETLGRLTPTRLMEDERNKIVKSNYSNWRWLALFAVFGLIVGACQPAAETTTTPAPDDGATTAPTDTDSDTDTTEPTPTEGFSYSTGIISDPTTDNVWAYLDPESDVYNAYVLGGQPAALYTLALPFYVHAPVLAEPVEIPTGEADGDNWVIEVPLREGATWSDGEAVDANDVAFTFAAARDLNLAGNMLDLWPRAAEDDPATEEDESNLGLLEVEAVDDYTVRFVWNGQPGLALWQFNTAFAPIMPEHFWGEHVAAASEAGDLYAVSGLNAPSFGATLTTEREPGAFVRNAASENYTYDGAQYTVYSNGVLDFSHPAKGWQETWGGEASGGVLVEYAEGPFISDMLFNVYGSQDAAALALINGDIDYWLNPLTLTRGLQGQFLDAEDLQVVANSGTGMFYMAFNTRRFPGNDLAFRQAVDCMIDKDFVAENILAGAVISMDTTVAPGNAFWSNPDVQSTCPGMSQEERLNTAVQILSDGGWTWETQPEFVGGSGDVIEGQGLTGPNGETIDPISLIAPGPGYDPMRATYSLWAQTYMEDLGIPVTANPTGFTTIVDQVFTAEADWDMYILGWSLGIFPDYLVSFFHSRNDSATAGGNNTPGYSNPEFDAIADQFSTTQDIEEARDLAFQMQEIIAREAPYVVLFTNVQFDVYRNSLEFPFTDFLQGITDGGSGLPALVQQVATAQ